MISKKYYANWKGTNYETQNSFSEPVARDADASDGCIEIPQYGTKHSLNVSTTAGIVIWEFAKYLLV